jgi:transcriptional antiterminator NusG
VKKIDAERGKLELEVSIFGRSTPVELEFWQVVREQ